MRAFSAAAKSLFRRAGVPRHRLQSRPDAGVASGAAFQLDIAPHNRYLVNNSYCEAPMAPVTEVPAANPTCRLVRAGKPFQGKQAAPTPMNRRASSCCPTWTPSTRLELRRPRVCSAPDVTAFSIPIETFVTPNRVRRHPLRSSEDPTVTKGNSRRIGATYWGKG
jgi:hypothetical protein